MSAEQGYRAIIRALARPAVIPRPPPYVASPTPAFVPVSSLAPDPNRPIHTDRQQRMLRILEYRGHWGLAMDIYEYARSQLEDPLVTSKRSWKRICDDLDDQTFYVYIQLLGLPTRVLESLIRNTITSDVVTDPEIREFCNTSMESHYCPGVYLNVLALPSAVRANPSNSPSGNAGKWLTPSQAHELAEAARMYAGKDNAANQYAEEIDGIFSGTRVSVKTINARQPEDRRYLMSDSASEELKTWSVAIDDQFYKNVAVQNLHMPHLRCPTEVGWSLVVGDRQKGYVKNASTPSIYGFTNAWIQHKLSANSTDFPILHQFSLFRVWKEEGLPQITETLASLLCSSSWTEGGMNSGEAGENMTSSKEPPPIVWSISADHVFLSPHLEDILAEEWKVQRNRWIACKYADPAVLARLEAKNAALESKVEQRKARRKELDQELADVIQEQEEMQRKRLEIPDDSSEEYRSTIEMIKKVNVCMKEEAEMKKDAARRLLMSDKEKELEDAELPAARPPNPYLQELEASMAEWKAISDADSLENFVPRPLDESEEQEFSEMLAEMKKKKAEIGLIRDDLIGCITDEVALETETI